MLIFLTVFQPSFLGTAVTPVMSPCKIAVERYRTGQGYAMIDHFISDLNCYLTAMYHYHNVHLSLITLFFFFFFAHFLPFGHG